MTTNELEMSIISSLVSDMYECLNLNTLSKLYRQARIWTRLHFSVGLNDEEKRKTVNAVFKAVYNETLERLQWES